MKQFFKNIEFVHDMTTDDETCRLPREIGTCKDFTERWYYDQEDEECRAFLYGGCDGNDNNFESRVACQVFDKINKN